MSLSNVSICVITHEWEIRTQSCFFKLCRVNRNCLDTKFILTAWRLSIFIPVVLDSCIPSLRRCPSSCLQCSWASILSFYNKVATLREPSMAGFKCIAHSIEDKLHRDDHYGDCTGKGRERKLCRCCG